MRARGLRKVYRGSGGQPPKEALKRIDLDIPEGSIFGLLGPNGAGKSTFINVLAGLVMKTEGQVDVWGFDIDANPRQARASIGVVPQELNLDPFFTPIETLEAQAGLFGVPKAERRSHEILDLVGLADKADAYARSLSGGMRRRLLVAKAMVHNPPILVLDEPTAGVDIELRKQMWDNVRALHARGVTIVLTTHYLEEAQELCDQIAIIDQGSVRAYDTTANLLKLLDSKTVTVCPSEPLTALPPALSALDASLMADGRIQIRYKPSAADMDGLLTAVQAAGVRIKDLSTHESDLEDIFLKLTGS
ncbi:MAG: ABC transporter ATP-binding protein [Pseudomonadota bacterium]